MDCLQVTCNVKQIQIMTRFSSYTSKWWQCLSSTCSASRYRFPIKKILNIINHYNTPNTIKCYVVLPRLALTQNAGVGFEDCPPLPQPHSPTHLPRVVFWHVNHLSKKDQKNRNVREPKLSEKWQRWTWLLWHTYHRVFRFWVEFSRVGICYGNKKIRISVPFSGLRVEHLTYEHSGIMQHTPQGYNDYWFKYYLASQEHCGQIHTLPTACPNIPLQKDNWD